MKTNTYFWSYLAHFLLEWEMFQEKFVEKIKTHILCSITSPPPKSYLYEIMWTIIVEQYGPQMTVWRMRIACWIPKATDTNSQYVILIAFPWQQLFREGT